MVTLAWAVSSGVLLFFVKGCSSSVLDLGNMLRVMTGRNPLDFVNYGNWCGLGGSGPVVDKIDRCCKMHDFCYDKASDTVCGEERPHLAAYTWKYAAGKIHCNKVDRPCGLASCRCDAKFAICVSIYKDSYDPRNKRTRPIFSIISNIAQLHPTRKSSESGISIRIG
ncbi:acidic phospholipase A2-like [Stegodyphus dumicola]|uniref:acidic phospholipase A2-like n=1 Tax=Stegodyphus dumicola TaxID=202533 RepID=UPI0015AF7232|nr:acidic phospholipase A2-like [Stegodyphus dumicola]XP_035225236.1 acidic phospholipase A2-like [Stegodyphus dumicola]